MVEERANTHNMTTGPLGGPEESATVTSRFFSYGVAAASVVVAILLTEWIIPFGRTTFPIFYGAVMVSAWYGGLGPGLLATLLSAAAGAYFFLPPVFSMAAGLEESVQLGVFIVVALLISLLNEARRQAEKTLAGQRQQLHAAISSISDAVITTDTQGRVTFMNPVAQSLTGWSLGEALHRPLEEIFHIINERTRVAIENPILQVKRHGYAQGLAHQSLLIAKDGRETPIDYSAAPIRDDGGPTNGVVLVFDNITERKLAQQATQQAADRTARLQAVIAALSKALTPAEVAEVTINQGVAATGAAAGAIILLDKMGENLEVVHMLNYPPEILQSGQRFSLNESLPLVEAVRLGRPMFIESVATLAERFPKNVPGLAPGHQALAAIPLETEGQVMGGIGLSFAEPQAFNEEDQKLLLSLIGQCAQAFQRARLYEAEQAARKEAEQAQHRFYAAATDNARLYLEAQEEIAARKQIEAELTRSLQDKEILLREVHHRVKNNLQAISNLLYLQSNYTEDQHTHDSLTQARNRVKSIALIHEKLYQTRDLINIDFSEYLHSLADHLIHSFVSDPDKITLNIKIEQEAVNIDTAVPLGIIINELVSNSLKYAFPASTENTGGKPNEIKIELQAAQDDQLLLTVADNGVGLPDEINPDSSRSLGLQLVRMLAGHMNGSLELDRSHGTQFKIKFQPIKMHPVYAPYPVRLEQN